MMITSLRHDGFERARTAVLLNSGLPAELLHSCPCRFAIDIAIDIAIAFLSN